MFILNWLRKLKASYRQKRNERALDACGENTGLVGYIDKRHPKSLVKIGAGCLIEGFVVAETANSKITIGNNTLLGGRSLIDCAESITIGDDVLISYDCIIADADNHNVSFSKRKGDLQRWRSGVHDWSVVNKKPITIEDGAWIGARSIILKGVTIGKGAVVGMGTVVTKDVAPFTIVAGNPHRVIREIPEGER
jgi:acetyltransferase-like isoleucine patch superfamily enzyme